MKTAGKSWPSMPSVIVTNRARGDTEVMSPKPIVVNAAPGTGEVYRMQVDVHLRPYCGDADVSTLSAREVQAFYDHCLERGRPAVQSRSRWPSGSCG
jgi:hypothetical protein